MTGQRPSSAHGYRPQRQAFSPALHYGTELALDPQVRHCVGCIEAPNELLSCGQEFGLPEEVSEVSSKTDPKLMHAQKLSQVWEWQVSVQLCSACV